MTESEFSVQEVVNRELSLLSVRWRTQSLRLEATE